MKNLITFVLLITAALLMPGCLESGKMTMPEGFVTIENNVYTGTDYAQWATNANKCILALREEDNLENAGLDFWTKTITNKLIQKGYKLTDQQAIATASGRTGALLKFSLTDMTYWVAVFVKGDKVFLPEAGGKKAEMKLQEEKILGAIRSLDI